MNRARAAVATGCAALAALVLAATVAAPREFSHFALLSRPVPLYPLDAAVAVLLAGAWFAWRDRRTAGDRRRLAPLAVPAGLWLAWGIACAVRGVRAGETVRSLRDLAMNGYPLAAVAGCWLAGRPGGSRLLGRAWLAGCVLLAARGAAAAAAGWDVYPELPGYAPAIGRYLHGAESAFLCAAGLGLVLGGGTAPRIGGAGLLFAVAVLGQQRSVFLALGAAAFVLAVVAPRPGVFLGRLLLAALTAAAVGLGASALLAGRCAGRPEPFAAFARKTAGLAAAPGADATVGFRRQAWAEALARWRAAPVAGEGYGRVFGFEYRAARPAVDTALRARSEAIARGADIRPHNTYLTILYKSGLIGLALFGWLAWRVAAALRARLSAAPDAPAVRAAAGVVFLLAAFGAVNLMLESPFLAVPFWGAAGAALATPGSAGGARRR